MAGKAKNKGFKALLVNHAEKGVFGLAALASLAMLGTSRWSHYQSTPEKITSKVKESSSKLEAQIWPEEEWKQFQISQQERPDQVVYDNLRREFRTDGMEFSTKFVRKMYDRKEPLKEPLLVGLLQPLATANRVLVRKPLAPMTPAEGGEESTAGGLASTGGAKKPKEKEEELPDELKQAVPMGGVAGGPGGPMGPGGPAMMAPMYTAPDLYSGSGMSGMAMSEGGPAMPTMEGEGHHYVSVRAVFPVKDQIRQYAQAIHRPFGDAARVFDIINFELERQELVSAKEDKWSEWTKVDADAAQKVLENSDGFAPEIVSSNVTNSVMTMPLPARVFGMWRSDVTHPQLEKFQLSDSEVSEQVEYNRKLMEKYLEDQKTMQQGAPKVERKGFSGMVFDNREVQSQVMGGGSMYDTSYMSEGAYGGGGGYGGGGYGGSSGGYGGGAAGGYGSGPMGYSAPRPGAAAGPGGQMTPEALMKKLSTADSKEVDKTLAEYIRTRATVDGELLLFRYIDFAVEPGKTYRYRVRLELLNPNFGRQASEANGEASVVQGETRFTKWSDVTPAAYVKPDVDYFVAAVDTRKSLAMAKMNVFQWDSKMGTIVQGAIDSYVGQAIGAKQKVEVINPPKNTFEQEDYTFASKDFIVDAQGDAKLDQKMHTDLKFTTSSGDLGLPAQVLVGEADGELQEVDPIRSAQAEKDARKYQTQQATAFDYLKKLAEAATGGVGGLVPSEGGMYDMYGGMGSGSGSKKNVMKKGKGGGYGSAYGDASGGYPGGNPMGSGGGPQPGRRRSNLP
jgi:hypothetical protein